MFGQGDFVFVWSRSAHADAVPVVSDRIQGKVGQISFAVCVLTERKGVLTLPVPVVSGRLHARIDGVYFAVVFCTPGCDGALLRSRVQDLLQEVLD